MSNFKKYESGFTLIEIMVVIVIIGLIAGMVVPQIVGRSEGARKSVAVQDLNVIANALEMYRLDNFRYPTKSQGLKALVEMPESPPKPKNWNQEGYIKKLPLDPWGSQYQYIPPKKGKNFGLFSFGPDGISGGKDGDEDIYFDETTNNSLY